MTRKVVTVSVVVHYLKEKFDNSPVLQGVMIEGEVSNFRRPQSGHWYFTLKDDKASLAIVMFAGRNRYVPFTPKNGDKVVVKGDITVYESEGRMQMIAAAMEPSGIGDLYLQLEKLKVKLAQEGLFEAAHKKPLKRYPENVAIVTGSNTAAREDVLITLKKRWPLAAVHEYPCPVQGMTAAPQIIAALAAADKMNHDVILLVRGGGSIEDLWCFNDEALARFIYDMCTPVVTGIGHEIDFTLADFVSDVRANTPTGAVEAAVPDQLEVMQQLAGARYAMESAMKNRLQLSRNDLKRHRDHPVFAKPERLYAEKAMRLEVLRERISRYAAVPKEKRAALNSLTARFNALMHSESASLKSRLIKNEAALGKALEARMKQEKVHLDNAQAELARQIESRMKDARAMMGKRIELLQAYSPLAILSRGYSITMKDTHTLASVDEVEPDDLIRILLADGEVGARVETKEKKHEF
ncbi:MAG: exodeoxyribonuclease VII large subunit [Solobacterium sp.]|nr:exodeoxyribonuclease VII large subunit [Solobacterium sp.]